MDRQCGLLWGQMSGPCPAPGGWGEACGCGRSVPAGRVLVCAVGLRPLCRIVSPNGQEARGRCLLGDSPDHSSFSVAFRGGVEAAQRAPAQRLHGAELPEPEPRPQPAHQPGPGGAGPEERGLHGRRTGALAGLAGGGHVDRHGCLRHGPHSLPRHAALQPDRLELLQP